MKTCVICLSGGMDSTTAVCHMKSLGYEIHALGICYGQRHSKELESALAVSSKLQIPFTLLNLPGLKTIMEGSSQTSDLEVPEGHYAEESMKLTVVPNRNMVILALASSLAISKKLGAVVYACHSGDHAIYPDCRKEFAESMKEAISLADWHKVELITPFVDISKADICLLGSKLKVPFELTWSCYKGLEKHCGKCGTCVERKEAFQLAGVPDPTEYL